MNLTENRIFRSKSSMGTIKISYCSACKKVGNVTEYWFINDAQKRSTDYKHLPLELCEKCAKEAILYLERFNRYKSLDIGEVVLE